MSEPLLAVEDLHAFYGPAHVLHGVSFTIGSEPVSILGRNGMGKTTLCAAIMGMTPPRVSGSIRVRGSELVGKPSYKVARLGVGYVPQGRRLFPSLTVDEHLRMVGRRQNGARRWTPEGSSLDLPSGSGTAARSSRAGSSKCSRSVERC
jgi:branched-chain amino acid transport system ATP-binding protein